MTTAAALASQRQTRPAWSEHLDRVGLAIERRHGRWCQVRMEMTDGVWVATVERWPGAYDRTPFGFMWAVAKGATPEVAVEELLRITGG